MKVMKLFTILILGSAFAATASFAADTEADCCIAAKKAGKECAHECCVEARKKKETVCEACGGKKEEKKKPS
jgi:hypothetical protein